MIFCTLLCDDYNDKAIGRAERVEVPILFTKVRMSRYNNCVGRALYYMCLGEFF